MRAFAIKSRRILGPLTDIVDGIIIVRGHSIEAVGRQSNLGVPDGIEVIDVGDHLVAPGFVDLHHHGAVGAFASRGVEDLRRIAEFLPSTGCTAWLPTVGQKEHCPGIVKAMGETVGAEIVGIHMEGPFLVPVDMPGRDDRSWVRPPDPDLCVEIQEAARGHVKIMGVGIEMDGAMELIRTMRGLGIVPALAHSRATYDQFMTAVDAGLRHITHTFNEMSGMHHRKPGVVGGALTCDQVTCELIADGHHVHPAAIEVLLRCRGPASVAVITDNIPLAGLPDGRYVQESGTAIIKKNGTCRLEGHDDSTDGTLAGSPLTMDHNLRTLVNRVGVSLREAVQMATLTPATIAGVQARKGSLEPGKDADIVIMDSDFSVKMTLVRGKRVFG